MSESRILAKEARDVSLQRGYLTKQLYVISTMPTRGMEPILENMNAHLEFQEKLEREGIMFAAGPNFTQDETYWEGEGTVVIRASSLQEAQTIAGQDPMHTSGARSFTVRPWMINEGTIKLELGFATGKFKLI